MPSVFSAALGKELIRRVPEGIHSANIKTLGKFVDSGSAVSHGFFFLRDVAAPVLNGLLARRGETGDVGWHSTEDDIVPVLPNFPA